MTDIFANLTRDLVAFRDARDWRRFHSLKNLLVAANLEAAELLDLAQWKDDDALEALVQDPEFRARLAEETADVFIYLLLICERAGIDLGVATRDKIAANDAKYPVEKARGTDRKYTEL
jgi:NTP pyrophosphatase (non-canonical NTP hydrolase)